MTSGLPTKEGAVPGSLSSLWLLHATGPVYVRAAHAVHGVQTQRPVRCRCARERDSLIVADDHQVLFICRCGRRQRLGGVTLQDVVALVEAEPVRPNWVDLDDALNDLGFARARAATWRVPRIPGGPPSAAARKRAQD